MPLIERELTGFELASNAKSGSSLTSLVLKSGKDAVHGGFTYELTFPLPNTYRILLTGPDRSRPPHDNVVLRSKPLSFEVTSLNPSKCTAVLLFPQAKEDVFDGAGRKREIHLTWADSINLAVFEEQKGSMVQLFRDVPDRAYSLSSTGMVRHYELEPNWIMDRNYIHLGLGEKAAPMDLTLRNFTFHGTDCALYNAYHTDPLYKHTPFLITTPRPKTEGQLLPSTYAIYHATNSNLTWDVGRLHDEPWGNFKEYSQEYGGLEEYVMLGAGVKQVVRTFAELVGRPKLVGRDWLGYLASGMGLGESDDPPAQQLLEEWPDMCKKYDIPCSAMHVSRPNAVPLTAALVRLYDRQER